jgi:MFS family permease
MTNFSEADRSRIFLASCFALVTTSLAFSIRAGILSELGKQFHLNNQELGYVNSMAFLGFPIATIVGGYLYNVAGSRNLMGAALLAHVLGIVLTIFAGGFWSLLISTFFIGFGNGMVEAACNPLIAELYPENKTKMLNKFHVWFPGGIVIGSLVTYFMGGAGIGWQAIVAVMLIPTAVYALLFLQARFPDRKADGNALSMSNLVAMATPLYIFMALCMTLTATTELGTQQWIEKLLQSSGVAPLVVLALITGLMAVGRYFAGPVVHRLNPTGVLWASSVIALAGIGLMTVATGALMIVAAVLFAVGVCYFWPTMLGFVAEYLPKTGALGMSLVGGAGMFATSMWQPVIGGWLDKAKADALQSGLSADAADLAAGQATLDNLALFPFALVLLFGGLYFYMRGATAQKSKTHG